MKKPDLPAVKPLTQAEAEGLEGQYDLILQRMAELDGYMARLDTALAEAIEKMGMARITVETLKVSKSIATERLRNLKALSDRMR